MIVEQSESNYSSLKAEIYSKEKEINYLKERDKKKDEEMVAIKEQVQTIMDVLGIVGEKNKTRLAKELYKKGVYRQL